MASSAAQQVEVQGGRSMGHLALHYPTAADGPLAARLMAMLGYVETQDLLLPDGTHFYRFVVDARHTPRGDGIVYLSVVPEAQRALTDVIHKALRIGTEAQHEAVTAFRARMADDPEYSFHYGTLMDSLEDLEAVFLALQDANRNDPDLKGRLRLTYNRPLPGNPAVDARLDASPVYGEVTRHAYGRNAVQAFVGTDLLAGGVLGEAMTLEFDYVFPGYEDHVLSVVESG